ncbi:hypothetical protein [Phenylobacterium sp. J367]|uniref:hypothetical protein n=1 Tax=Phenylobacterium sp. J367 TaxID=2898435 RepID=UPI002150D222|nr:hypothetical protein [Phenylobacterium sp. J367]MCR5878510.1 hypothetical protein [Phenylobacterium sp. J367]
MVAEPAPPPAPAVDPAAATAAPEGLQLAVVSPDAADVSDAAEDAAATPEPKPEPKIQKAAAETCAAATPADRAICGDPELQRLQKDLRQAYAEALEAHADRATLRQRQLAWREARNDVDDPERLAGLYSQRIRKLEAATAEARRLQR